MSDKQKDTLSKERKDFSKEKDILGKDDFSFFVLKKGERMTAALFLVTDFLPANESLRREIRDQGLAILSLLARWRELVESEASTFSDMQERAAHLLGLLRISVVSGSLSSMNAEILIQEYILLLKAISENRSIYKREGGVIDPSFFNVQKRALDSHNLFPPVRAEGGVKWGGNLWEGVDVDVALRSSLETDRGGAQGVSLSHKDTGSQQSAPQPKGQLSGTKGGRREKILDFIRRKERVSVKDIAKVITGCSEKTLQRELVAMVREGVLKKEGERRWSTYLLA